MERPKLEDYEGFGSLKQFHEAKNEYIDQLESEKKELIESTEALIILVDARLVYFDCETVGKGKSYIWNKVVKTAQDLINKLK